MFKNYFILNRLAVELNKEIKNYVITRVFSFEKDKLVLLLLKDKDELSMEISVNPGVPYIIIKKNTYVPKKNLVNFFEPYLPTKINSVEISELDRIINIKSDKTSFYFTVRGKYTNFFSLSDEINSFKKVDKNLLHSFRDEVSNHKFIQTFNDLKISEDVIDSETIKKTYPIIGREIINEAKLRFENDTGKIPCNIILKIINEVKVNNPAVFIDEDTNEVNLGITTFKIFSFTEKEEFTNVSGALNYFLIQKFSRERIVDYKKVIEKYIDRELTKISSKLNNVQSGIEIGTKEKEYNKTGNLLLINISNFSKGLKQLELQDIYNDNSNILIKLDPKLSPKQNVEFYFNKARNEKVRFEKSKQLMKNLKVKYNEMQNIKEKFIKAETHEDYKSIMKELKIKPKDDKKPEDDLKNKFRHYLLHSKYNVYVGKDSKSNDQLTLKFAKQNDYWFHARSDSGSHVVLKNENVKEGIPKNILKNAASIAAYHSKAKTSGLVPVSYTQKKYVVKKKGMEAGKVSLLREEVLIVRPEIPSGSVYDP